jgi:hypothetical protein
MADRSQIEVMPETGGFRIEGIEIKRSTITAHMKDIVGRVNHFVEAVTMMVAQSRNSGRG